MKAASLLQKNLFSLWLLIITEVPRTRLSTSFIASDHDFATLACSSGGKSEEFFFTLTISFASTALTGASDTVRFLLPADTLAIAIAFLAASLSSLCDSSEVE